MDERTPADTIVDAPADGRTSARQGSEARAAERQGSKARSVERRGSQPRAPERQGGAERRAPERRLYTLDQLLGRSPIWLRRRTDKWRLASHVAATLGLLALTVWWVVPLHTFAGPVLLVVAPGRGIHAGDLPTLVFLLLALRSLRVAGHLARRVRAGTPVT